MRKSWFFRSAVLFVVAIAVAACGSGTGEQPSREDRSPTTVPSPDTDRMMRICEYLKSNSKLTPLFVELEWKFEYNEQLSAAICTTHGRVTRPVAARLASFGVAISAVDFGSIGDPEKWLAEQRQSYDRSYGRIPCVSHAECWMNENMYIPSGNHRKFTAVGIAYPYEVRVDGVASVDKREDWIELIRWLNGHTAEMLRTCLTPLVN